MKKNLYLILIALIGLTVSFSSCQDDEKLFPPTVNIETEADFSSKIGEVLTIDPKIASKTDVTCQWLIGEDEISTDKVLKYTCKQTGKLEIKLIVSNNDGTTERVFNVSVYGPYKNGTFILSEGNMGNETGVLAFIDENGVLTDSVYQKANDGRKLGNVAQDLWIRDGKIYIICQNGAKNGGDGNLIIANAETLTVEKVINDAELAGEWPTHIVVCNNDRAYIRSNAGIHLFNTKTQQLEGMLEGGQGANKQKMEYINGRALIPAGSNLLIINPNDDSIEKTIPAGGSVSGIAEGKDKCLWIAVNGETPSFVKINTDDFTVDETIPAEGAKLSTGWIPSIGFCASKKDNSLYWRQGATIYKFDMTDKTVSELVKFSDNSFVDFIYGDINIHPETDEIYAGTIKGYQQYQDSKIHVINSENGEAARSPYLKHMRFMAGPFFTADFNQ